MCGVLRVAIIDALGMSATYATSVPTPPNLRPESVNVSHQSVEAPIRCRATSQPLADRFIARDVLPLITTGFSRSISAAGFRDDVPLD
jgi:hypothetical protein